MHAKENLETHAAVLPWEIRDLGPDMNHYRIGCADGRASAGIGQIPADAAITGGGGLLGVAAQCARLARCALAERTASQMHG